MADSAFPGDLIKVLANNTGATTFTFTGAVPGFDSAAAVANGTLVSYAAFEGTTWEVGQGVVSATGTQLTRATVYKSSSGGTTKVPFLGNQQVIVGALLAADLLSYLRLSGGTMTGDLLFIDALYDIGKSAATRPRDGFFSRALSAGTTVTAGNGFAGLGGGASVIRQTANSAAYGLQVGYNPTGTVGNAVQMLGNITDGGVVRIFTNYVVTDGDLILGTFTNQNTLALFKSGRVGIGSTSDDGVNKLQVSGSVSTNGLLDLSSSTAGQIKFPATQNTSSDPNTLDDYERGTWTPGIAFGGAATGITYGIQAGKYVKTGRGVIASAYMTPTSLGSSTGALTITGLPFGINDYGCSMVKTRLNGASLDGGWAYHTSAGTTAPIYNNGVAATNASLTAGCEINATFVYNA